MGRSGADVMATLKTVLFALLLSGVFLMALPWLILQRTEMAGWWHVPIGRLNWAGAGLIAFGVYLYVWSVRCLLRRQTSAIPGQAPTHLQTSGWYARVRHPLLLGVVAVLWGEAVWFKSLALVLYAAVYWLWLHLFVTVREERDLRHAFGAAYDAYAREVPRWIPRFW